MKILKTILNAIINGFANTAKAERNIWKLIIVIALLTQGCASMRWEKPSFKSSAEYKVSYTQIWSACMEALSEETIASTDKAHGQITTAPKAGWDIGGNQSKSTTVKITYNQYSKVFVVRVMVKMSHKSMGAQVGFAMGEGITEDFSDISAEQELLEKIDELISQGGAI